MGTVEERLRILKMVEEGAISPDEGTKLLEALSAGSKTVSVSRGKGEARWLRVRVTDVDSARVTVNINVPMGLVRTGLKMGARFIPSDVDFDYQELINAIHDGETGKIVEVTSDDGEEIEVWLE